MTVALFFGLLLFSCSAHEEPMANGSDLSKIKNNGRGAREGIEKVVGTFDEDGKMTMTADTLEIKRIFENDLKQNGITTKIDKIEMLKGVIDGTPTKYYYLLGTSKDGTIRIATEMYISPQIVHTLIVMMRSNDFFNSTCTCNGCPNGCSPKVFENEENEFEWKCTPCRVGANCSKSVTATP